MHAQAAQHPKHGGVLFKVGSAQAAYGVQKCARSAQHAKQQIVGAARRTERTGAAQQQPMQLCGQGARHAQQAAGRSADAESSSHSAKTQHVRPSATKSQPVQGLSAGSTEKDRPTCL